MDAPLLYGIPPEAPDQPRLHPDRDLDIIIKLLKEVQKFMEEYVDSHLPYLVHDGLDDLVADFKLQIPILSQNTQTVVSILSQQPYGFNYTRTKSDLGKVGLTGAPLKAKDRSIRGHINRFFKYLKHGSIVRNYGIGLDSIFSVLLIYFLHNEEK